MDPTINNDMEIIPSDPMWIEILQSTKAVEAIPPKRRGKVLKVNYFDEVPTLLNKLAESKAIVAVVTDVEKPGVIGFVDVLDIMTFVTQVAANSVDISKESIQNLKWEGKCFTREVSGSLVNISDADPFITLNPNSSLMEAVRLFAKGIHHVAIVDNGTPNSISNLLSQSDVIKFLVKRGTYLGSKLELSVVEGGLRPLGVATVRDNVNVVDAIGYMRNNKISGIAVVDMNGRMIANLSASDFVGLNENNFPFLSLTVKEFLSKMHNFPKPPVICRPSTKIETVLMKMVIHKVHRVYIVDDTMRPTGLITMTDVMQFLLASPESK